MSRILYQQQQTLPSADELENMTNRIADLRLEQFEVNQQRDALFQSDAFVNKLEEGHTNEVNSEVHDALLQVVDMRRELLDQLNKQLGNQLMMAINLQINQQQLMSVSKNLKSILTQQIFWVNSNRPMDWDWIKAFPQSLKDEFKSMKITVNWEKPGLPFYRFPRQFAAAVDCRADPLASGLAESVSTKTGFRCGFLRNDSQLNTPKAILIDLIRALPVCLIILAVGLILLTMQLNISELLWSFSKKLAIFWLVFGLCWKVLEKTALPCVTLVCRNSRPATGVGKLSASVSHCCLSISGLWWQNFPRCI